MPKLILAVVLVLAPLLGCSPSGDSDKTRNGTAATLLLTSEVEWEPLNPARGDQSPQAGTLWGDRTGPGPAGFLLKPVDGFRSPPHIHGVAYRGVVISGLLHNDDPRAADMFMPAGSFWTQPAGEIHITAAKGTDAMAYIEVEDAFGVQPTEDAFASEERPVNVDVSNLVWVAPPAMNGSANGPKLAYLWGNPNGDDLHGMLVKLPAGFTGEIRHDGAELRGVVIQGRPTHHGSSEGDGTALETGSTFSSEGNSLHRLTAGAGDECIIYVRAKGKLRVEG